LVLNILEKKILVLNTYKILLDPIKVSHSIILIKKSWSRVIFSLPKAISFGYLPKAIHLSLLLVWFFFLLKSKKLQYIKYNHKFNIAKNVNDKSLDTLTTIMLITYNDKYLQIII